MATSRFFRSADIDAGLRLRCEGTRGAGGGRYSPDTNRWDVANCTAVGNVKAHLSEQGPLVGDEAKFRNQVIGFGGNTGFVTLDGAYGSPAEGVAYRCPAGP